MARSIRSDAFRGTAAGVRAGGAVPPGHDHRDGASPGPASPGPVAGRFRHVAGVPLLAALVVLAGCSSEGSATADGSQARASGATATSKASTPATPGSPATSGASVAAGRRGTATPPDGSGATVPGITATSLAPIVPTGQTRTKVACRQLYPVITDAVGAWNSAAASPDTKVVAAAATALTKAATDSAPLAAASGDTRLVQLTDAVATQLKALAAEAGGGKDIDGTALTTAQTKLWEYCQIAQ